MSQKNDFVRCRISIRGAVQGVGFRPFIYRLAKQLNLAGWVRNSQEGVVLEVEGIQAITNEFILRISNEKPVHAVIQGLEFSILDPAGMREFEIRESDDHGDATAIVLPDIGTCSACLSEIFDPADRRYRYPFTNCTNCGPRFTIVESLPYDRSNTSMKKFEMCARCRQEYEDPSDRRFHAQPNACPDCGPHLALWDETGRSLFSHQEALSVAADHIRDGKIVALKGIGGFHLMVDARNEEAVLRLRKRKRREEKPFAVLFAYPELVKKYCRVSPLEERLLLSSEAPIVLLVRDRSFRLAPSVAPKNPYLGVLLPYSPLHHLLMKELGFPVVATSGNVSDEPICTDENDAVKRLHDIADFFLVHDRPIVRHVDDSIARVSLGRELVLRRARGYAPLPVPIRTNGPLPELLAVGGHLKNTVALTCGKNVLISQHIGDLETQEAFESFQKVIESFRNLYRTNTDTMICDLHPDYFSTRYAKARSSEWISIQHHYAHVASCMAENELDGEVLGVSWDGTGYGLDETIWGGEFLLTDESSFTRVASFRLFRLPGSAAAIREPRRSAIGLLYELFGDAIFDQIQLAPLRSFDSSDLNVLRQILRRGLNSPLTSSVGRLFDVVASLLDLQHFNHFEGQASMQLEFLTHGCKEDGTYDFQISKSPSTAQAPYRMDWGPTILEILDELRQETSPRVIAAKFHNTLAEIIVRIAQTIGKERIVLTGGCFQNRYLTERSVRRLEESGFHPYWHQRVPPNDGGLSLGQMFAAIRQWKNRNAAISSGSVTAFEGRS